MEHKQRSRVTSPEDMNSFMRVGSPAMWLTLILMAAVLLGALAWGCFATLEMTEETGEITSVHPITFIIS